MRFFLSFLFVGSAIIVAATVVMLVVLLMNTKGRRSLVLALRSLRLHKVRAALSVSGIIISTTALISSMAFSEGSMQEALDDIKRLGATNLIVRSVKPADEVSTQTRSFVARYGITQEDYDLFATIPTVVRMVPMRIFPKPVYSDKVYRKGGEFGNDMWNARIVATTPQYQDINKIELTAGRFLVDEDSTERGNVCVLGSNTAAKLFPYENPIDQTILIDKFSYTVIGVAAERQSSAGSGGSQAAEDFNSDVYIPLGTAEGRFGKTVFLRQSGSRSGEQVEYSQVTLTVSDNDEVRPTGEAIKTILDRHQRKDTELTVPLETLELAERAKDRFLMLVGLIALISLLVGGIGIMNIMLATVTERTREIGVRRALGAKRRDITMQFLIEAIVQTTVGALVGVCLALTIIFVVPWCAKLFDAKMPAQLHNLSIVLAMASAIGVGVLFGWYPAYRAAMLDPIEALRHE